GGGPGGRRCPPARHVRPRRPGGRPERGPWPLPGLRAGRDRGRPDHRGAWRRRVRLCEGAHPRNGADDLRIPQPQGGRPAAPVRHSPQPWLPVPRAAPGRAQPASPPVSLRPTQGARVYVVILAWDLTDSPVTFAELRGWVASKAAADFSKIP